MNLLPRISKTKPHFSDAISWLLTSDIQLKVGIVSCRRLLLFAVYHLIPRKVHVAFMSTDSASALDEIRQQRPGVLIVTPDLEQGYGIELVEQAHRLLSNLCSILIVDSIRDDLNSAFHSCATCVITEQEIFAEDNCQDALIMSLARGRVYRSPLLKAGHAGQATLALSSVDNRQGHFMLTGRELDVALLLMKGCSERSIAETLGIGYTTVRSHSRSLRRKFGVTSRSQLLLRLIDSGFAARQPGP